MAVKKQICWHHQHPLLTECYQLPDLCVSTLKSKSSAVRNYASLSALCSAQQYDNCVSVMCKLLLLTVVIEHKVHLCKLLLLTVVIEHKVQLCKLLLLTVVIEHKVQLCKLLLLTVVIEHIVQAYAPINSNQVLTSGLQFTNSMTVNCSCRTFHTTYMWYCLVTFNM